MWVGGPEKDVKGSAYGKGAARPREKGTIILSCEPRKTPIGLEGWGGSSLVVKDSARAWWSCVSKAAQRSGRDGLRGSRIVQ